MAPSKGRPKLLCSVAPTSVSRGFPLALLPKSLPSSLPVLRRLPPCPSGLAALAAQGSSSAEGKRRLPVSLQGGQLHRDVADLLLLVPLDPRRILPPVQSPVSRVVAFWLLVADGPFSSGSVSVARKGFPNQGGDVRLVSLLSAGGRCTQWRLRSRRLLKKFGCLGDRSELPAEVASTGVGPAESRDQAQTVLWPGKEGEVEDKREVTANVSQSRGFPLHPVPEQQNKKANPQEYRRGDRREKFQRGAPKSQCPSLQGNSELSVEELNETIFKDHCYCVLSEAPLVCCTLRPCPLREHDYCGNHKDGVWALKDHDYCHVQGIRSQGRVNKIVHLTGKARAVLRRLAARKSRIGRIVRKARRILWHYRPWVNKRLEFPESLFSTSEPPVLPAQAEDDPTKGTPGAFCSPAKREAASPQPRSEGSSQGTTAEAFCVPVVSSELVAAPPPSNAATEVKREATRPEASVRCEAQRAQLKLLQSPDAKQNDEGQEAVNSDYVSLHDAYKMVMRTVDQHAGLRLPELRARRLLAA